MFFLHISKKQCSMSTCTYVINALVANNPCYKAASLASPGDR